MTPKPTLTLTLTLTCALLLGACDLPHDPVETLEQLESRPLRVGVAESEPWVVVEEGPVGELPAPGPETAAGHRVPGHRVRGLEPALVRLLADELGTSVTWHTGGEGELLEALERYELDLVVGGLTRGTPWSRRVGLTTAYVESGAGEGSRAHVWAVAPGENGFLMRLEHFLERQRPSALRTAGELGMDSVREPRK